MSLLLDSIVIKNKTLRNKVIMSPMCQYMAENGIANDWHMVHYGARAVGKVGMIIQEATAVCPEGRISPNDLGIWSDTHRDALKPIVDFVKSQGTIMGIQLAHAGRKASTARPWDGNHFLSEVAGGWQTVAPSSIPFYTTDTLPVELSIEAILNVVQLFKDAAVRAIEAGYDAIEIHAAHGYLIHEFMSPITNHRNDEYGGCFENRIKFLLQIVDSLKSVITDQILIVRISGVDYLEGGWGIEDSIKLSNILSEKGVDMMDISSGAIAPGEKYPIGPMYQTPLADAIKKDSNILVATVGMIDTFENAERILNDNKADLICLGRPLLSNPHWVLDAMMQDNLNINPYPKSYKRSVRRK